MANLIFDIFIIFCILLSCTLVVIEFFHPDSVDYFFPVEAGLTAIFTAEYIARWYLAPHRLRYPFQWLSLVDLFALLPSILLIVSDVFFVRIARTFRVFRLLRLLRLMRLVRLIRFSGLIYRFYLYTRVRITAFGYRHRARPLAVLFLFAVAVWIFGANLLYITESGSTDNLSPFAEYWESYWNIIIVLMSGIEDKEPVSVLGRIEISLMLILGIVIVGYLTGEIVSLLVQKWQRANLVALMPPRSNLKNHIVILGINERLTNVVKQVDAALEGACFFLIVDEKADTLMAMAPPLRQKVFALVGNPSEKNVLDMARIDDAARIVVLSGTAGDTETSQDIDNRALTVTLAACLRDRERHIPTTVEIVDKSNLNYAKHLLNVDYVVGQQFGERLISQCVRHPGVSEIYHELFTFTDESNEIYFIQVPKKLIGKTVKEAQLFFLQYEKAPITLLAIQVIHEDCGSQTLWCCQESVRQRFLEGTETLMVLALKYPKLSRGEQDLFDGTYLARH
ncbi:MAG: ion transporter [Deltaproteobacteria bacterium]|nr:ion transporter [Deltaproteobacteria bacterium]